MPKKTKIIVLIVLGIGLVLLITSNIKPKNIPTKMQESTQEKSELSKSNTVQSLTLADKIEIVHFHGTQQCWSCITVGEYALNTIKERFPEEYESGKIVFKDINGELKENQEIVFKYQARGSSLFVNAITGEKDNIQEDVTVWRFVSDEAQFKTYFENRLNELLGK